MVLDYTIITAKLSSPLTWIVFMFGSMIGSFLNVVICRLPYDSLLRLPDKSLLESQRSYCTYCQKLIPFYLNIPIFGYLLLRGKTQCCRQKLSMQYPLVELFTGIMLAVIYWHFPFLSLHSGGWHLDPTELLFFAHASLFAVLMLVCSVIDLHHMIIPDVISITMIVLSPIVALMHPTLDMFSSIMGVVIGGGSFYLVAWVYFLIRKQEGMGLGDVKLLAAIGGWLGYQSILPTILYSSTTGAVVGITIILFKGRNFQTQIPFGPFLAMGALIHLLYGPFFQEWLFLPR